MWYPDVGRLLGTPDEATWPNVTELDDWNLAFPKWPRIGFAVQYREMGVLGINMLEVSAHA